MEKYISKSALVAEIKNLENTYKKCPTRNSYEEGLKDGRLIGYKDALHKINTLEVKEADLEKELDSMIIPELKLHKALPSLFDVAKHFFELGVNTSNPLTWDDINAIRQIMFDYNRQVRNGMTIPNDEEYCQEVLKRFKAQKREKV